MMSYEEFTQKEAALESAPRAEREAFYAEILEKETAKTDVRMMAYFHAALLLIYPGNASISRGCYVFILILCLEIRNP